MDSFFRSILWSLTEMFLSISDLLFDITKAIVTFDFFKIDLIMQWYTMLMLFMYGFILIRVFGMYFKDMIKEENTMTIHFNPVNVLVRCTLIIITIYLAPALLSYLWQTVAAFISNIGLFLGINNADTSISELIKSAMILSSENADLFVDGFKINMKLNGEYVISFTTIFIALVSSCGAIFSVGMLSLQVAKRFYNIIFTFVISVYPLSSLINFESDTFKQWFTILLGDILSNAGQILFFLIVLMLCSSSAIQDVATLLNDGVMGGLKGTLLILIMLIGGFFAVLSGPTNIARLFGNGFGVNESMNELATMSKAGSVAKLVSSSLVGAAGGAALSGLTSAKNAGKLGKGALASIKSHSRAPLRAAAGSLATVASTKQGLSNFGTNATNNIKNAVLGQPSGASGTASGASNTTSSSASGTSTSTNLSNLADSSSKINSATSSNSGGAMTNGSSLNSINAKGTSPSNSANVKGTDPSNVQSARNNTIKTNNSAIRPTKMVQPSPVESTIKNIHK